MCKKAPHRYEKEEPHPTTHLILAGSEAQDFHTEGQEMEEVAEEEAVRQEQQGLGETQTTKAMEQS